MINLERLAVELTAPAVEHLSPTVLNDRDRLDEPRLKHAQTS